VKQSYDGRQFVLETGRQIRLASRASSSASSTRNGSSRSRTKAGGTGSSSRRLIWRVGPRHV